MIKMSAKGVTVTRNVAQQPVKLVEPVAQHQPKRPVGGVLLPPDLSLVRRIEALEREMAEFRKIVEEITGLPAVALKSRAEYYREYRARKKQSDR